MPQRNTLAQLGDTPINPEAQGPPADPYGFLPYQLPPMNLDLQSYNRGTPVPSMQGGITLPLMGNELQLRYGYEHDPYAPARRHNFGATLMRRF